MWGGAPPRGGGAPPAVGTVASGMGAASITMDERPPNVRRDGAGGSPRAHTIVDLGDGGVTCDPLRGGGGDDGAVEFARPAGNSRGEHLGRNDEREVRGDTTGHRGIAMFEGTV